MLNIENGGPSAFHSDKSGSLFLVIPESFNWEYLRHGHSRHYLSGIYLGCVSDGSPLPTGGDDGER